MSDLVRFRRPVVTHLSAHAQTRGGSRHRCADDRLEVRVIDLVRFRRPVVTHLSAHAQTLGGSLDRCADGRARGSRDRPRPLPSARGDAPLRARADARRFAPPMRPRPARGSRGCIEIPFWRLALAFGLVLLAVALSRMKRLSLESDLLWGALRGAVQLIAIGHVLLLLFRHEAPGWVGLILAVMVTVAAVTSARRVEHGPPARVLFPFALAALFTAAAVALIPVFALVVPLEPWFNARYVVPNRRDDARQRDERGGPGVRAHLRGRARLRR